MISASDRKTGVLLLNLGGPDSIDAVKPFLFNLFSDRDIIRLGPAFLQKPLAYLIATLRCGKTEAAYERIGGKSPILDITKAQAELLEAALNPAGQSEDSKGIKVSVAMRYWRPLIEDVIPQIHDRGIRRLIVLNLYPQYSVATSGSSISALNRIISRYPIETFVTESWFDNPYYIEALVENIREGIETFGASPDDLHILFSAHSLPVKFIEEGDPYVEETKGTIQEITKRLPLRWHLSYQSKSGPVQWLEPSTETMIEKLADEGVKNLLVVPVSFVSDHIETLYEIDIVYKAIAEKRGMKLKRTESLNKSPLFIIALRDIVLRGIEEAGWRG